MVSPDICDAADIARTALEGPDSPIRLYPIVMPEGWARQLENHGSVTCHSEREGELNLKELKVSRPRKKLVCPGEIFAAEGWQDEEMNN
jgi:hypothetical protein